MMTDISQAALRKEIDMTTNWKDLARATIEGSESGTMTFPPEPATLDGGRL